MKSSRVKKIASFLTSLFLFASFFLVVPVKSFAESSSTGTNDICNPEAGWFNKLVKTFDPDAKLTAMVVNYVSASTFGFNIATGSSWDETMNCMSTYASQIPGAEKLTSFGCDKTDAAVCTALANQHNAFNIPGEREKFASGRVAGSLLGLAYSVDNELHSEPVPVNMAYFFKDYAYRLPIVGEKVYAADGADYKFDQIKMILAGWKIMRNLAYAVMSIIMLWVGITIITRQKISQQVVVNVQYALPKVFMALVFIAFSYPIGATIATLSWALYNSMPTILTSTFGLPNTQVTIGIIVVLVVGFILQSTGIGFAISIGLVIVILALIITYLAAIFKILWTFMKMLAAIVYSPLQIAISAIPGNEDQLLGWFKQLAAWGLGIVAMGFTIQLVMILGLQIMISSYNSAGISGTVFAMYTFPFFYIFGFSFALKTPDMVQNAIVGETKKKR